MPCCTYERRRYLCGCSVFGIITGCGISIYGGLNLPTRIPAQNYTNDELQQYIQKSFEFKVLIAGLIIFAFFLIMTFVLAFCGLCRISHSEGSGGSGSSTRVHVLPITQRPTIQISDSVRIRAPSSLSPQLTQQKMNVIVG